MVKKYLIGILTLVLLTASIYILIPNNVRIDVGGTYSTFKVWENDSWVLAGQEYTLMFDGTTKMRASSRTVESFVEGEIVKIVRTANFKDNVTVIDTYTFDGNVKDIELFPISHEINVLNGEGYLLVYEVTKLEYFGDTIKDISSPQSFGHNMKIDWEEGNYYSRIWGYADRDEGKLTVKYRPDSPDFTKQVRLFDPPVDRIFLGYNKTENKVFLSDATIKLDTESNNYIIRGTNRTVAEFTIENKKDYLDKLVSKLELFDIKNDMKEFDRKVYFRYKNFYEEEVYDYETICKEREVWNEINKTNDLEKYDCVDELVGSHFEEKFNWIDFDEKSTLPKGNVTIAIVTDVFPEEHVEWIPTIMNIRIPQWAEWTESLNVDLVAYWKLEEASGHIEDAHGSHDSVSEANVGYGATGIIDDGLSFAGNGYATMAVSDDFAFTDGFAFSFWVKPDNTAGNYAPFGFGSIAATGISFTQSTSGDLYFFGEDSNARTNEDLSTAAYQHIVGVREDDNTLKIYVNGVLQTITGSYEGTITATAALSIGAISTSTRQFPGDIDEVGIWDRNLSQAEVTQLYNEGSSITYIGEFDYTPPNVTINSPINQTYNTKTIVFNVTALDETEMKDCNYTLNEGITNYTMANSSTSPTYWNATNSTMSEGGREVIYHCWDATGNLNDSEDVSFFIDSVSPTISFVYPENKTYATEVNAINYTYVEINCDSVKYSTDEGATNSSHVPCGTNFTGVTSLEGSNNWTLYINDSLGNVGQDSVAFFKDTIIPNIEIVYPSNNTNWTNVNLDVNFTRSDTNLASCWYSNDTYLVNTTLSSGENVTSVVWTDAFHNVTVWCNDSAGNENASRISFTIDTTPPDISITYPSNNTNTTNIEINVTYASDTTAVSFWWSNDSMSINHSLGVYGNSFNITNITWNLGQHNVTVWANDSVGNENSSSVTFWVYEIIETMNTQMELGSSTNITVSSDPVILCVDIDHPDYGINYSCSANLNVNFNISSFRKTTSNGDSSVDKEYLNQSTFNVSYLNISAHQYDEVDYFGLNISSGIGVRDLTFYKVNTTNFDRAYQGYLIDNEIYLNKSCDSSGEGICAGDNNLTFPNSGSQVVYFYIDDNIGDFNFTLNISGGLYGFEYEDLFYNDTFIDWDNTSTQLDLSGVIMAQNVSYKEFSYDDFEDGNINPSLWETSGNWSYENLYSYDQYAQETDGYIEMYSYFLDPGDDYGIELPYELNSTALNMYASDEISFNLSHLYVGTQDPAGCSGNLKVYAGDTLLWTSMYISTNEDSEYSLANVGFHLKKINSTTWKCNITGLEYSEINAPWDQERWNNWTSGNASRLRDGDWISWTINNTFYFDVTYGYNPSVRFYSNLKKPWDLGCNTAYQRTKVYYVNNSKWLRTNGTITSKSVFDSSGDIADATFIGWGYEAPGEVITPYLSADGGTTWESVTWGVKHSFSVPGKHLKWAVVFSNISYGYLNKTSYLTDIKINTTQSNPSNITLDFGDDKITNVTLRGEINSTNGTITVDLSNHDLTNSFTSVRSFNEIDYGHLYIIPLVVYSDSRGYVNLNSFNLTYNPNPIILNTSSIQDFLDNSNEYVNFSVPIGTYSGNFTIDDIQFDYAGGNDTINVTVHSADYSYSNQTNITLWYSRWDYGFVPQFVEYLEFIPDSPTDKNVSAYGQSNLTAILNLTNQGYGGRDATLSIYLNETLSCVNLTISNTSNKLDGFIINDSWKNITDLGYLNTNHFWLWADYGCSYSDWHLFNPSIYFSQCCVDCYCSEEI